MVEKDVALELEDDVFFADLSRRIALLIMDDDGGEAALRPQRPSIPFQEKNPSNSPETVPSSSPFGKALSHASRPALSFYKQACRREIRGTGVFIPQCSLPRRKQRAGRSRHAGKSRALAPATTMDTATKDNKNGRSGQQQPEIM